MRLLRQRDHYDHAPSPCLKSDSYRYPFRLPREASGLGHRPEFARQLRPLLDSYENAPNINVRAAERALATHANLHRRSLTRYLYLSKPRVCGSSRISITAAYTELRI